jgi:hypothetical protein
MRNGSISGVLAGVALGACFLAACGGGSDKSPATPTAGGSATSTPAPVNAYPTPYPGVLGVIQDFLIIRGTEFFPAIPPCSAYETTDDHAGSLLEFGFLPEGAEQTDAWVSRCPDGEVYATGEQFDLADGRSMSVYYTRAPYSYPIVLGDPAIHRIDVVDVDGHRGLLIVAERERGFRPYATLRFWVEDQYDAQKAGAYIEVGIVDAETPVDELADELLRIGEGVHANVPSP